MKPNVIALVCLTSLASAIPLEMRQYNNFDAYSQPGGSGGFPADAYSQPGGVPADPSFPGNQAENTFQQGNTFEAQRPSRNLQPPAPPQQPSTEVLQPPNCDFGKVLLDGECVNQFCGAGQVLVEGQCVSFQ
jgi:hypothetical protein